MATRYLLMVFVTVSTLVISATNGRGDNLSDLLTTLYGGKGVPVTKTSEKIDASGNTVVVTDIQVPLDSFQEIQTLNTALNIGKGSLPVSSTGGGFTFRYDRDLEVFTRTTDSLGPIFAERAPTLGQGKLNFGFSYTYIKFSTFEGDDLDNIQSIVLLDEKQKDKNLLQMNLDIDLTSNLFSFYGTYGVTDRWDISLLVPVLQVQLDVNSTAKILNQTKKKGVSGQTLGYSFDSHDTLSDSVSGASTGLGDILLRNKYNLITSQWMDFASALDIKLPTGDGDELLGTGKTSIKPFLIFSKTINRFTPHLNLGYEFNSGSEGEDRIVYTTGSDYTFGKGNNHFTVALDIIGSHKTDKSHFGKDIVDFSTGFKWSPRMGTLVFVNVQIPLNEDGLRADWIPTVGYELNF
ncbi:MAG: hypothetical protein HS132_14480 [Planctomycetia bacterium]|nr:hypothetical protein [Planctomycetia bacterium]